MMDEFRKPRFRLPSAAFGIGDVTFNCLPVNAWARLPTRLAFVNLTNRISLSDLGGLKSCLLCRGCNKSASAPARPAARILRTRNPIIVRGGVRQHAIVGAVSASANVASAGFGPLPAIGMAGRNAGLIGIIVIATARKSEGAAPFTWSLFSIERIGKS
jgi:hypothetical protein